MGCCVDLGSGSLANLHIYKLQIYVYIKWCVYIYKYITCQMKGSIICKYNIYIFTIYRDHFVINRIYIYIHPYSPLILQFEPTKNRVVSKPSVLWKGSRFRGSDSTAVYRQLELCFSPPKRLLFDMTNRSRRRGT